MIMVIINRRETATSPSKSADLKSSESVAARIRSEDQHLYILRRYMVTGPRKRMQGLWPPVSKYQHGDAVGLPLIHTQRKLHLAVGILMTVLSARSRTSCTLPWLIIMRLGQRHDRP